MDIAITLPKHLWDKIVSGEKKFECRKRVPFNFMRAYDKVYVILKGTKDVAGYFSIEEFRYMFVEDVDQKLLDTLCIDRKWFDEYAKHYDELHFWKIRKNVHEFPVPKDRETFLNLAANPQSYVYCTPHEKPI